MTFVQSGNDEKTSQIIVEMIFIVIALQAQTMNSISNKEKTVKPAYESVACSVVEVEPQGVLCASNNGGEITGGLNAYNGSEL